jgi:tetratricopeptide (TPR) repeat protein
MLEEGEHKIMGNTENREIENDELTHQALRLFIEKTRRENAETRSWIKQPNNLISVVAIVLSLYIAFHQIRKEHADSINQDLASFSKVASDLTQLDYQSATTANATEDYWTIVNNRRAVLLAEADLLLKELDAERASSKVPPAQLAALGPEYAKIGDSSTAMKYFQLLAQTSSSPTEKLDALRSIAVLYADEGTDKFEDARKAFAQAANIYPDPKDIYTIGLELQVNEQWANFDSATQNYEAGFQHLEVARSLANRYPCVPMRDVAVARLNAEGQTSLEHLRKSDPAKANSDQLVWSKTTSEDKCPKTSPATSVTNAVAQINSKNMTTVCRFTSGPRAGTVFDFKQFGLPGIPVGCPCTDGQGSNGVATR